MKDHRLHHRIIAAAEDLSLLVMTNAEREGLCPELMLQFPYTETRHDTHYIVARARMDDSKRPLRLSMDVTSTPVRSVSDYTAFQHMGLEWLCRKSGRSLAIAYASALGRADHITRAYVDSYLNEFASMQRIRYAIGPSTMMLTSSLAANRYLGGA